MCTTCDQLFVVFMLNRRVDSSFRTETAVMQCRLFANLVGESLLRFNEERARVTTRVGPVEVWVFSWILFPRRGGDDAEIVQGCHRCRHRASNHAPFGFFSHFGRSGSPRTGDVNLFQSVLHSLALELEPSSKLIKRKPDSWVSALAKMKMQDGMVHVVLFLFPHESAAIAHLCWLELGPRWQNPSLEQLHSLMFELQSGFFCDTTAPSCFES